MGALESVQEADNWVKDRESRRASSHSGRLLELMQRAFKSGRAMPREERAII